MTGTEILDGAKNQIGLHKCYQVYLCLYSCFCKQCDRNYTNYNMGESKIIQKQIPGELLWESEAIPGKVLRSMKTFQGGGGKNVKNKQTKIS